MRYCICLCCGGVGRMRKKRNKSQHKRLMQIICTKWRLILGRAERFRSARLTLQVPVPLYHTISHVWGSILFGNQRRFAFGEIHLLLLRQWHFQSNHVFIYWETDQENTISRTSETKAEANGLVIMGLLCSALLPSPTKRRADLQRWNENADFVSILRNFGWLHYIVVPMVQIFIHLIRLNSALVEHFVWISIHWI